MPKYFYQQILQQSLLRDSIQSSRSFSFSIVERGGTEVEGVGDGRWDDIFFKGYDFVGYNVRIIFVSPECKLENIKVGAEIIRMILGV